MAEIVAWNSQAQVAVGHSGSQQGAESLSPEARVTTEGRSEGAGGLRKAGVLSCPC